MVLRRNKKIALLLVTGLFACLGACGLKTKEINTFHEGVTLAPSVQATSMPELTLTLSPTATPTEAVTPIPTVTPLPTATPTPVWQGTDGEVSFSEAGYFFSDTLTVELVMQSGKDGYVTYTMDGTEPTENGEKYESALVLDCTEEASPNIYSIRAKAWYTDGTASETYVHTYFVGQQIAERYSTVVFSINGNPAELTEGPDGILYGKNYEQRGRESERVVSIEALTADGEVLFSQYAGARVFGGSSREHAIKSLKLFARKEYQEGKGTFETTLFGSMTADGKKAIEKYDKLVLRNGGDDFQAAFMRDEAAHRLAEQAGFATYEAVVPAVAYINGEYYGFYWLHESYCDKYFQYRNGKSKGEYVVVEGTETQKFFSGDDMEDAAATEFNQLYKTYSNADLTNEKTYEQLCAVLDVENYMEYMAFNMYLSNYDWPHGNYRCFRYYADEGEAYGEGEKDGRWRFLLHDMDIGFATYTSAETGASRDDISAVLTKGDKRYAPLLAALLKREDCKQFFLDTMLRFRDGVMTYENICEVVDAMCMERDTELAYYMEHLQGLKKVVDDVYATPQNTKNSVQKIKDFAELRGTYVTTYLEDFFQVDLSE